MTKPQTKQIRILYDSFHNNIGDKAIGLSMVNYFSEKGFNVEVVDPFSKNLDQLNQDVVIGGGDILHDEGHPFYDSFRLSGSHILNAAGVSTDSNISYLKDYKYLSVRSETDKAKLSTVINDKNIHVIPCSTMLLEPKVKKSSMKRVGFHFHHVSQRHCQDITAVFKMFNQYEMIGVPFTHYNDDLNVMREMFEGKNLTYSSYSEPQEILDLIASFDYFICSSLHAAIFSYIANVPFLVHNYHPKVEAFMKDRGLQKWLFADSDELAKKVPKLIKENPDYIKLLKKDRKTVRAHFDKLLTLISHTGDEINYSHRDSNKLSSYAHYLLKSKQQQEYEYNKVISKMQNIVEAVTQSDSDKQKAIEVLRKQNSDKQKAIEALREELSIANNNCFNKFRTVVKRDIFNKLFKNHK